MENATREHPFNLKGGGYGFLEKQIFCQQIEKNVRLWHGQKKYSESALCLKTICRKK